MTTVEVKKHHKNQCVTTRLDYVLIIEAPI